MENVLTDAIKKFLYVRNTDFFNKYNQLDGRYPTMKAALNLFYQRNGKLIVETGCQREENDWGGGMSTALFAETINLLGGKLITVDNVQEHLNRVKRFTKQYDYVEYVFMDSVEYLNNCEHQIDLLYLDSFDYPMEDLPGGFDCVLSDDNIVQFHSDIINPCQEHCLKELEAAIDKLTDQSVILIDDNNLAGGGKPRLAREWLFDHGWTLLLDGQQTLWINN
jgi:hypothetical protein